MIADLDRVAQVRAIRERAAGIRHVDLAVIRVSGEAAWELLDRLLPCELYLREGQLRPTLLLAPDGSILADVFVGADELDFWLLVDGMSEPALLELLEEARLPGEAVEFHGHQGSHLVLGVEGPYAWQVLEEAGHAGISAMPFLTIGRLPSGLLAARAGRTGEYGYLLLLPLEEAAAALAGLPELVEANRGALSHCALESWSFDIWTPGLQGLSPLELQLQWRLSWRKIEVQGVAALNGRRKAADRMRTVGLRGPEGMVEGDLLSIEGEGVGRVLARVPWLGPEGGTIGVGLLPIGIAHPGIEVLEVPAGLVRSVSPPFLTARSFRFKPSRRPPDPASQPDPYA